MISVCLASYNGEQYIRHQISSILEQLNDGDELIVSDDQSTDNTIAIVESFHDKRIRVLHHIRDTRLLKEPCAGFRLASDNFENALKAAKGDYVFLSDQDDVWVPGRKEKMLAALQQADCVMCNYAVIDQKGTILIDKYYSGDPVSSSFFLNLLHTPFLGCCMAFTKESLRYILPFPKKLIGHDLWIGCLTGHKKKMLFLNDVLHLYRTHETNVSPATAKSKNSFLFKVVYRLEFLYQLCARVWSLKNVN